MNALSAVAFVLFLLFFSLLSYQRGWYNLQFDTGKRAHRFAIALTIGISAFTAVMIFRDICQEVSYAYPFTDSLNYHHAYEQMFDAFLKRQVHLDVPVSDALLALENPYDPAARYAENIPFLWDRAFYNGQYYSYFGIAPILTVYFPFFFLTGRVPSSAVVMLIFTLVSVVAIALLVVQAARMLCARINFCLLLFSVSAVEFGSLLFMLEVCADMYYIAAISAVCFLALTLLCIFSAFLAQKKRRKMLCFILSGVFLVLTVMSRPNVALLAGMTAPLFLQLIFDKKISRCSKLQYLAGFAIPVAVGAALQMCYNFARFDNPLDFGARYQLTICDVSTYSITPLLFFPALFHYFFKMPELRTAFPYFHLTATRFFGRHTGYIYNTTMCGAMVFPSVWSVFAFPVVSIRQKKRWKSAVLALGILTPVLVAFINTCIAGVNIRYLADIMLVLVLTSVILLMNVFERISRAPDGIKAACFVLFSCVLWLTATVGFLFIFENERFSIFW